MATTKIDAKWMHWIKDNLERGSHAAELGQIVADNFGISVAKAAAVVAKAKVWQPANATTQSYVSGKSKNTTINSNSQTPRRDWMMRSLDTIQRLNLDYLNIPRIDVPCFKNFILNYYSQNRPVILNNAFSDWPMAKWTPDSIAQVGGDQKIEVQVNRQSNPDFEMHSLRHKKRMPFSQYHHKVMTTESSNDFYMTANNAATNLPALAPLFNDIKNIGDDYFDSSQHSKRSFIWYGPKGNFTPLHHDETNNMFLQVYGQKRFILVPPLQTPYLYNTTAVFSPVDFRNFDTNQFPMAKQATPIELILSPGDTLFIPLGWWHQVESLDISISLTMTHFNIENYFPSTNS